MEKRILNTDLDTVEIEYEEGLRPDTFDSYLGQEKIKENVKIYIEAAKKRKEPLDHVLFYGPPGLGKTTLAGVIARELGVNIKVTSGPAIDRPADMASILMRLSDGDVLFIDEIHRLNRSVEEFLYPVMEDFEFDPFEKDHKENKYDGKTMSSFRVPLPHFTLIGATTRAGMLSAPLRDRFGISCQMKYYSVAELEKIVMRSASVLGVDIDEEGALEIARRSRGTPRLANRLLKRVRDFAEVKFEGVITKEVADYALNILDIDKFGLDEMDRRILETMIHKYSGRPVGIESIAAAIGEDSATIEDVYEQYLVQTGFIDRTARGRVATDKAYVHMGLSAPQRDS